jgi:hypothetical protein
MSTNAQYLNLLVPEVPQGIKDAIMLARGLDPLAAYSGSEAVELAEADLYSRITLTPEFSEGALSLKYNVSALKAEANRIYLKYGDARYSDADPVIKPGPL